MTDIQHYNLLAELFRYPGDGQKDHLQEWLDIISRYDNGLITKFGLFREHISSMSVEERQEYYISTFDVQALCYLDIGYVLFGEDHRRGIFLSHMKREQESAGNQCGSELADHLPNVLTLLPKIRDRELAGEMMDSVLIPAIREMIRSFGPAQNVYRDLLEILEFILESDYKKTMQ
jgi:nitrate reductase molybdenum cofactor assembly chaperone